MTAAYPTPHTIGVAAYREGDEDAHGNPVDSWDDPVDVAVYGWAQPTSDEPKLSGRQQLVVDLEIFTPPDVMVGPYDVLHVDGALYAVEGAPEDYNHGPFRWRPGRVINARRVDG